MKRTWEQRRRRVCEVIEIGNDSDLISRGYDFVNTLCIIINLIVSVMYTFEELRSRYGNVLLTIEGITVLSFAVDYILRIWTAKYAREDVSEIRAILKYVLSFTGIVDILSFLPYYLPVFSHQEQWLSECSE